MLGRTLAPALLVASIAAGMVVPFTWAGSASAQDITAPCQLCRADSQAAPEHPAKPIRLEVQSRLEFDKIVFGGLGEAQYLLSPTGVAMISGATTAVGARAMPGSVMVRGEPGRAVRILIPGAIQLTGEGGNAIRIESIVTDLPDFPRIGDDGTLSFRFGGDLRVSGDSDGAYRGSIEIVVEYL